MYPAPKPGPGTISPEDLARMCKGLGHPARVRILLHLLAEESCVCGRIVEILPYAQSTVSQHLKALKESGLVRGEVEGPCTCYCVDPEALSALRSMAAGLMPKKEGPTSEDGKKDTRGESE